MTWAEGGVHMALGNTPSSLTVDTTQGSRPVYPSFTGAGNMGAEQGCVCSWPFGFGVCPVLGRHSWDRRPAGL